MICQTCCGNGEIVTDWDRLIAEACDELIAFWDGSSTGTKYTIGYACRIGKPVEIVRCR